MGSIKNLMKIPEQYKATNIEISKDDKQIHVTLEPYKRKKAICGNCGEVHTGSPRGTKIVTARDLPVVDRKVFLHVVKRRYVCPADGKIHIEEVEWLKKKAEVPIDMLMKYRD